VTDTLAIIISGSSLVGSVVALIWARRAIAKADRIRASTESVDRLEMRKIAGETVRALAPSPVLTPPCDFDVAKFTRSWRSAGDPPPDAHGWMS
jgi:hypothetical protein